MPRVRALAIGLTADIWGRERTQDFKRNGNLWETGTFALYRFPGIASLRRTDREAGYL